MRVLLVFSCAVALQLQGGELKGDLSLLHNLPVRFEAGANAGTYQARGLDYRMTISPARCTVGLSRPDGANDVIAFRIEGADDSAGAQVSDRLAGTTNYFDGNRRNWRTQVPGFGRVRYNSILPDIDVVYYGSKGLLEFDFIVQPGGDPSAIQVRYSGQQRLRVDETGNLILELPGRTLTQRAPAIYQREGDSMRLISGGYELKGGGLVGYRIAAWNKALPLVIDPALVYSSYVGGSAADTAMSVARDKAGRLYIAGTTVSSDLTTTEGSLQTTPGGLMDGYLMIVDPNAPSGNQLVYSTLFGGSGDDEVKAIAVDGLGRVHLTGVTTSTNFPLFQYPLQGLLSGTSDAFLITIDPAQSGSASLLNSTYLGGTSTDAALAISAGADGRVVIAGYTDSSDFPLRGSAAQSGNGGGRDAFVASFDVYGTLDYATYLGGDRTESARAVALAGDGNIYVAGSTLSAGFPITGNARQPVYGAGGDAFLTQLSPSAGTSGLVYSTYLGGNGLEAATGVAISGERVIVTGYTTSSDYPVTAGALSSAVRGPADIFVTAFDLTQPPSSGITYSTLLGGSDAEVPYAIVADAAGRAVITGYTTSNDFPVTQDALQSQYGGGASDALVTVIDLNKTGQDALIYSTYLGGTSADVGYALATDTEGRVYLAGSSRSRRFPLSNPNETPNPPASGDGFVVVLSQ